MASHHPNTANFVFESFNPKLSRELYNPHLQVIEEHRRSSNSLHGNETNSELHQIASSLQRSNTSIIEHSFEQESFAIKEFIRS